MTNMKQSNENDGTLFVWRGLIALQPDDSSRTNSEGRIISSSIYYGIGTSKLDRCPFCVNWLETYTQPNAQRNIRGGKQFCARCGFSAEWRDLIFNGDLWPMDRHAAILKNMSVNDSELALHELGSHLKRHFNDVHLLTPRRFEELVADIYQNLGFSTRLTQETRDGGYDIMLLERTSGEQAIVECKRYSNSNKVRVGIVREVLGVQFRLGVRKAKIVTTSQFTTPAMEEAAEGNHRVSGYELELINADRLLHEMDVYNTAMPPLHLDSRFFK
jgi:hypothetical protein